MTKEDFLSILGVITFTVLAGSTDTQCPGRLTKRINGAIRDWMQSGFDIDNWLFANGSDATSDQIIEALNGLPIPDAEGDNAL